MHTVQSDSNNILRTYFIFSQFYVKVLDYGAVRLSSCQTIDKHSLHTVYSSHPGKHAASILE